MEDLTWVAGVAGILMAFAWLGRAAGLTNTRGSFDSWRATAVLLAGSSLLGLVLVQTGSLLVGYVPNEASIRTAFHLAALALLLERWLPRSVPRGFVVLGVVWLAPTLLPPSSGLSADLIASLIDPRASSTGGWWIVVGLGALSLPAAARIR